MRAGMFVGDSSMGSSCTVDELEAEFRWADEAGLDSVWLPHIPWSLDSMSAAAIGGRVTTRLEIGTAVLPMYARHPLSCAQEALTVNAACSGRFSLGIGTSHAVVGQKWYGQPHERMIDYAREYVGLLAAAMAAPGSFGYEGEIFRTESLLMIPGATAPTVLLAALSPLMLRLAGEQAAGTITWMADARALADHVVPRIRDAAQRADRPEPRILGGLPICICDDEAEGLARAEHVYRHYAHIPSYAAMLERGDARTPGAACLVGPESIVSDRLARLEAAGMTDLCAMVFGVDDGPRGAETIDRTRRFLVEIARGAT